MPQFRNANPRSWILSCAPDEEKCRLRAVSSSFRLPDMEQPAIRIGGTNPRSPASHGTHPHSTRHPEMGQRGLLCPCFGRRRFNPRRSSLLAVSVRERRSRKPSQTARIRPRAQQLANPNNCSSLRDGAKDRRTIPLRRSFWTHDVQD